MRTPIPRSKADVDVFWLEEQFFGGSMSWGAYFTLKAAKKMADRITAAKRRKWVRVGKGANVCWQRVCGERQLTRHVIRKMRVYR